MPQPYTLTRYVHISPNCSNFATDVPKYIIFHVRRRVDNHILK